LEETSVRAPRVLGRRGETDCETARAALARGCPREALEAVRRARRLRPSTEGAGLALAEADALFGLLRFREAVGVATRALAQRPLDVDLAARLRVVRGQGLWMTGRVARGLGEVRKAATLAEAPLTQARVLETLGLFAWKDQELEDAMRQLESARDLYTRLSSPLGLLRVLAKQAGVLKDAGRFAEALGLQDERLERAEQSGRRDAVALARNDRAGALAALGRWDEAREEYEAAAQLFRDMADPREHTVAATGRVVVDLAAGDLSRARAALERAREINAEAGDTRALAENLLLASDVHLAAGEPEAAERTAVESLGLFRVVRDREGECRSRIRRAHALVTLRRFPEAAREARRAERGAARSRPDLRSLANLALGRALIRHEQAEAATAFQQALAVSEGRPVLTHAAQLGLSSARGASPDSPEIAGALDGLRAWGDRRILAYGLADLQEVLGMPASSTSPSPGEPKVAPAIPVLGALADAAAALLGGEGEWASRVTAGLRAVRGVLPWCRAILVGPSAWELRHDGEGPIALPAGDLSRRLAATGGGPRVVDLQAEPCWRDEPTRVLHGLGCALLAPAGDGLLYVDLKEADTPPGLGGLGLVIELGRLLATQPAPQTEAGGPADAYCGIVGRSPGMRDLFRQMARLAPSDLSLHILGETGTGKEMVAEALHRESRRRGGPFVAINASSLSDELFEAEMCGHTRGAFTGAVLEREGHLAAAEGGTLFLDEVTDLSPRTQAKLLRILQSREYRKLGESRLRRASFRLITASNLPLEGRLRSDLAFRIREAGLELPPLRERGDDLWLLAAEFLRQEAVRHDMPVSALSPDARRALEQRRWPGNVRELQSEIKRAVVFAGRGPVRLAHLTVTEDEMAPSAAPATLKEALLAFERRHVGQVLARHGGNRARTAMALGISRQALVGKIARMGL
jgi:transcriptional regulator with AAA-type ATPase domain/tetratricopeptide (TPR) repeat protein